MWLVEKCIKPSEIVFLQMPRGRHRRDDYEDYTPPKRRRYDSPEYSSNRYHEDDHYYRSEAYRTR